MALKDLLELVQTLSIRIDRHGDALRKSETLTRYTLIDPLLRALDWNTQDPSTVVPEYPATGGRADYALLDESGKPVIMVEAKKLDEPLEKAATQGIQYTLQKGVLYFAVTDGQRWHVYETHKPVPLKQKRIVSFDLRKSMSEACRNALALWRPGVLEEQLQPASPPLRGSADEPETLSTPISPSFSSASMGLESIGKGQTDEKPYSEKRITLSAAVNSLPKDLGTRPTRLQFPDQSIVEIKFWNEVITQTAHWLFDHGRLTKSQCPVQTSKSKKRFIVAKQPTHPSRKPFKGPKRVGSLYLEANLSRQAIVRNTAFLIHRCGMAPAHFQLYF